jgi:hypothetical protein
VEVNRLGVATDRTRLGPWLIAGFVVFTASCSVIFSADDLSNGTTGSGGATQTGSGAGGSSTSSGGAGGCRSANDCDDGDECTRDTCDPKTHRCVHPADVGASCGHGTDCTPRGACNAEAHCVPGEPDPALCDDHNPCTLDTCETSGCAHAAMVGTACNDGQKCDDVGACNDAGKCVAAKKIDTEVCIQAEMPCPGNYYVSDYHCDMVGCGDCPLCVNAFKCSFACEDSFVACCNIGTGDCSAACPTGYHAQGGSMTVGQCGCETGTGITCAVDTP